MISIGKNTVSLEVSPQFDGVSKVIINVSEAEYYEAGTNTGRTLTLTTPWGTQKMAEDILAKLQGYAYQPYTASQALIDPAAELGDGLNASGIYGGIFSTKIKFGPQYAADIEAPEGKEINHEYPFISPAKREILRQAAKTAAQFKIQNDVIAAKVSETGGDNKSFGWSLTSDGFILASNGKTVFAADKDGIAIDGKITARSGFIGNGSKGFAITDRAIYNGVLSYDDVGHSGVYLGTDGIVLGKGKFKVDSSGNLYATSGTFTGTVYANRVQAGGSAGYISGSQVGGGTLTTGNFNGFASGGISNGYYAYDRLNDNAVANYIRVATLNPQAVIIDNVRYRLTVSNGGIVRAFRT